MNPSDFNEDTFSLDGISQQARVAVAMSGGVDSSVVAALLAHRGYKVIGLTLQLYDQGSVRKASSCCAGRDILDARKVSQKMGFPHYILDYERQFQRNVIDPFVNSYADGETPLPCVLCNQKIKFTDLLETARQLGADCLATGHYVRRIMGPQGPELWQAADSQRDQSYFLFSTTRSQLEFLRFPLGSISSKSVIRSMAESFGLSVAEKPDSQDICFVPQGRYTDVIHRLRPEVIQPGTIVHVDGRILGKHNGIVHFTTGQRKGIHVQDPDHPGLPLFVIRIDARSHQVIVGPRQALAVQQILISDVCWLGDNCLPSSAPGYPVMVRVRSSRPPVAARIFSSSATTATLILDFPEEGVSPGQAAVCYSPESDCHGTRVLGGGKITSVHTLTQNPYEPTCAEGEPVEMQGG